MSERFWSKVDRQDDAECWLWTAGTDGSGYGKFEMNGRKAIAHRLAYELTVGPIPEGLELDHLCRNPPCVNPAHLEPVTHQINCLRGNGVGAVNAVKTHCTNGHEFTPENTYVWRGRRHCRACNRTRKAKKQRGAIIPDVAS